VTGRERRWRTWLLVACLLAVAPSRLLFIPGIPWEQDEALFAAAAFDTDLEQRRPHPPGFPLWVAVSKLSLAALGDPILGLQLVSALASILMVLLLARLWGAWLGPPLGTAAALLFAFLPGVLFHSPRAFTTTPALALACLAAVLWLEPGRRRLLSGSAALAAAILVRPLLAPPLAVLWLAAMALRRERWASSALSAVTTALLTAAGFLPIVLDAGGLGAFLATVRGHGLEQWSALPTAVWTIGDLGVVRSVGGWQAFLVLLVLCAIGAAAVARRNPRLTAAWFAVLATTAVWILGAHNPALPRYSLPLLALLCGPAVAGAAALLRSEGRAVAAASVAAALSTCWALPALRTQAEEPFPPLAALTAAQGLPLAGSVVTDGGLSPFSDLLVLANRSSRPLFWRPLLASGRVPLDRLRGRWAYVSAAGTEHALVPGPPTGTREIACTSPRLHFLSQRRYLTAWVADRGGLVLEPTAPSLRPDGAAAVDPSLTLLLQPVATGSWLGLVLEMSGSPTGLRLTLDSEELRSATLSEGVHVIHLPVGPRPAARRGRPAVLRLSRIEHGDSAVHLRRVWVDPPSGVGAPPLLTADALADGLGGLVATRGFFPPEQLGSPPKAGRWTGRTASVFLPTGPGRLLVRLCAPRPEAARVRLAVERLGWSRLVEVGGEWLEIAVPVTKPLGRVRLSLEVLNPFVPAEVLVGATDERELGVVLGSVALEARTPD